MMEQVQLVCLPKLEEMFGPPRSFQRKGYLLLTVLTSLIPQLGQFDRIALALQDAPMIDIPVTPVMLLTTSVSFTFICSMAFRMCWT